jgi:hypothetical protein
VLGRRVEKSELRGAEPRLTRQQDERLGDEGLGMRQVGEVVLQRDQRERVHRLRDEDPSGTELRAGKLEQAHQRRGRQMLEDLSGEDAAERLVGQALEVGDRVALLHVQAVRTAELDHVRVAIDARGFDPSLAEQGEELTASTADVEDGSRLLEVCDVRPLALEHVGVGTAHACLEREVVERLGGRGRRGRGVRIGRTWRSGPGARDALEPKHALLELRYEALVPRRADRLVELVDQLQGDVVEFALGIDERCDVPAQKGPEERLQRRSDERAAPATG